MTNYFQGIWTPARGSCILGYPGSPKTFQAESLERRPKGFPGWRVYLNSLQDQILTRNIKNVTIHETCSQIKHLRVRQKAIFDMKLRHFLPRKNLPIWNPNLPTKNSRSPYLRSRKDHMYAYIQQYYVSSVLHKTSDGEQIFYESISHYGKQKLNLYLLLGPLYFKCLMRVNTKPLNHAQ